MYKKNTENKTRILSDFMWCHSSSNYND